MTPNEREIRAAQPLELRTDGEACSVSGYAAVFGERANIADYFEEEIDRGAFDAALSRPDDVRLLIGHEGEPLARTASGTLDLTVDNRGLKIAADLDASDPDVARIRPKMERGDLREMSFGFRVLRQEWDDTGDLPLRRILEVELFEVSIVTFPAYASTEIGLRDMRANLGEPQAALAQERQIQRLARKARLVGA